MLAPSLLLCLLSSLKSQASSLHWGSFACIHCWSLLVLLVFAGVCWCRIAASSSVLLAASTSAGSKSAASFNSGTLLLMILSVDDSLSVIALWRYCSSGLLTGCILNTILRFSSVDAWQLLPRKESSFWPLQPIFLNCSLQRSLRYISLICSAAGSYFPLVQVAMARLEEDPQASAVFPCLQYIVCFHCQVRDLRLAIAARPAY